MNRNISFTVIVGSHNYNLNNEHSDEDYKAFFIPNFDDLYNGDQKSKSLTSQQKDIEYHDVRKLPKMLWQSNVNFLEILFSIKVEKYDKLYDELYNLRNEIARINLPYLFNACVGMFKQKLIAVEKMLNKQYSSYENNKEVINKHLMGAYRILDFLNRFYQSNFNDFKHSITYYNEEREFLMNIKQGLYPLNELNLMLDQKLKETMKLEEYYVKNQPNEQLYNLIKDIIKNHVKNHLVNEIK